MLGQRLHRGDQAELVTGVAIERLAEQGHIARPRGRQRQHPLLQVRAVVAGVPIGHGQGVRIQIRRVLPGHRERGGVHVHLSCGYAKALTRLPSDPGKQRGGIMVVQPIQCPPQAIVMQHLGRDPWTQQVLHRLGRKELRDQIQPAITEPQPIQDHRHRRRAHAHLLLARFRQRIQILCQPDLAADARHDAQMIQSLDAHVSHDAPDLCGAHATRNGKRHHRPLRNVGRRQSAPLLQL